MGGGYVPPQMRDKPNYKPPKKLTFRAPIDYSNLKTKEQVYEEYRLKNEGKADTAWEEE